MLLYPNVKINLGLSILRKRPDGFHDLETLFVPYFGLSDELEVLPSTRPESSIELIGGDWDPQTDLSYRALKLMEADFGIPSTHIRLTKRTPVGAGLGSGSADAAFTLKALNEMYDLKLSDETLAGYAARLGSDCAFFIYNRPMLGEGRGEVLSDYPIDLSGYEIRVETPYGVKVSTKEAYSGVIPRDRRDKARAPLTGVLELPIEMWKDELVNDFEESVFPQYPQIAALKADFYDQGAVYASMSGSGSAVFGIFEK